MNNTEKRVFEIVKTEVKDKGICPLAVMAIVEIESAFDAWAIRKEPVNRWLYKPGHYARKNHITTATETELQHFSFGLLQIMGSTARSPLNYEGNLLKLLNISMNLHYGIKYLAWIKKRFKTNDMEAVAAAFNAGSPRLSNGEYVNQSYVNKFKSARQRWGQELGGKNAAEVS